MSSGFLRACAERIAINQNNMAIDYFTKQTRLAIAVAMHCEQHEDCLELFKSFRRKGAAIDYDDLCGQALERLKYVALSGKQKCFLLFFFRYILDHCVGRYRDEMITEANHLFSN